MRRLRFGGPQGEQLHSSSHDEFVELCAISVSGALSDRERNRLEQHLSACNSCRDVMRQFEIVVDRVIQALAPEYPCAENGACDSWSEDKALSELFRRVQREKRSAIPTQDTRARLSRQMLIPSSSETWRHVWMLCAASVLLCLTLGFSVYQFGRWREAGIAGAAAAVQRTRADVMEHQLRDIQQGYQTAQAQLEERNKLIGELRHELHRQSNEMKRSRLEQQELEARLRETELSRRSLSEERSSLAGRSQAAESEVRVLQARLASTRKQVSEDGARVDALQGQLTVLTGLIETRNKTIAEQEELLGHDRDIRELMGARDLYIAEVYDVDRNGKTRKPFGRVFYTKGKSLVFYAYDLDQQPAINNAHTFQAWGVHGSDREQALSLGIFYKDNASKKRWVLKTSDPKVLERVDEVFVTVEPNGGSRRPSTQPFLFAYLKMGANHP